MDELNRVYVAWEADDATYFITTLDPDFNKHLQEMVADMGPPTKVEFRATDEGWFDNHRDLDSDGFFSDREANPHDGSMYGDPEGGYDVQE